MIFLFSFIFFSIPIIFYEYKKYKTIISPAVLTIFSLMAAILLLVFGQLYFNYLRVSPKVQFLTIISIYIIWLPSIFLPVKTQSLHYFEPIYFSKENCYLISIFITFVLIFLFGKLRAYPIGTEEFENNYSHGIFSHLNNLLIVLVTYTLCFVKKNIFTVFIIIFGISLAFISGTKYHVIFIFLVYVLKRLYIPSKTSFIKMSFICLLGVFLLFTVNYLLNFFLKGTLDNTFLVFALNHFLKYISGGLIGFSQLLQGAYSWGNGFVYIDSIHIESTNVYTFFGILFLRYKFAGFIILFFISSLAYLSFGFMLFNNHNFRKSIFFLFYSFFFGNQMFLAFFSSYYRLSNFYEWAFLAIILYFIIQKRSGRVLLQLSRSR